MKEKTPLTCDQICFVQLKVAEWIRLLRDNNRYPPTEADCIHSALLCRLLSGKDAQPKPPPLAFSYPAYGLADGEQVMLLEPPRKGYGEDGYPIVVEQHQGYKWVDDEKTILEHRNGDRFRVFLAPWEWKGTNGTKGVEHRWHIQKV